jgi:hypothetical protein
MMDLTNAAAYSDLTPYDLWQESTVEVVKVHATVVFSGSGRRSIQQNHR